MAPERAPGPATDLVLLHGTTIHRAQAICESQSFTPTETLYVVFRMHRDLAEFFARRKAAREHGTPAIVLAKIPEEHFILMRKRGEAQLQGFDPQDDVFLRGRNQWVISAPGVMQLNRHVEDIEYESV